MRIEYYGTCMFVCVSSNGWCGIAVQGGVRVVAFLGFFSFFFFSLFTASIFSFFIVTVAQSTGVGIGQRNEKYQKAKKVWGTWFYRGGVSLPFQGSYVYCNNYFCYCYYFFFLVCNYYVLYLFTLYIYLFFLSHFFQVLWMVHRVFIHFTPAPARNLILIRIYIYIRV